MNFRLGSQYITMNLLTHIAQGMESAVQKLEFRGLHEV
jgi:hypothetical protein